MRLNTISSPHQDPLLEKSESYRVSLSGTINVTGWMVYRMLENTIVSEIFVRGDLQLGAISFIAILGRLLILLIQNLIFPTLMNTYLSFGVLYKTWDGSERVLFFVSAEGEKGQRHIITFSRRFSGESPSSAPKREGKKEGNGERERLSLAITCHLLYQNERQNERSV